MPYDIISTFNTDLEVDFQEIDKPKINSPSLINNPGLLNDIKRIDNKEEPFKLCGGTPVVTSKEKMREARLKKFCKKKDY